MYSLFIIGSVVSVVYWVKDTMFTVNAIHGQLTPDRQVILDQALSEVTDPQRLMRLSMAFEQQGLFQQAEKLRKRANIATLSAGIQEQRAEVFVRAMQSQNKVAVINVANAFGNAGATESSKKLLQHAETLI